jgi:phage-related protein
MNSASSDKPLFWVGSSLKDLRDLPEEVKDEVGFASSGAEGTHTEVC